MNQKEIIEFAIKGITAEIRELESTVEKGRKYLEDLAKGKKIKSPKNASEIKEIIHNAQAKIEELDKKKFDLQWQIEIELNA